MGRIFEKRKYKMFARYAKMAKGFTKMGKEIAIAVKQGGPNPDNNPRLRAAIQNAKSINMPKDRIDGAIQRASSKSEANLDEVVYEGYGPHGVAILVETATDNPTRTVANIRMHYTRSNGSLGKTGSLDFIFERKCVFRISAEGQNREELELELIDHGAEEIEEADGELIIYTQFADFGKMQKALEAKKINILSSEKQRIPNTLVDLNEAQQKEINELVTTLEEDDDVQAVFHNMKE